MESNEQYHNLRLSEIEFLTSENLALFESFNIFTLGQLFGATRGLTRAEIFNEQENKEELIQQLFDLVPAELIETYQTFSEKYPTGLLKNQDDENETNHID